MELVGKEEEDDLYFEGGHHSQELVKLVVSLIFWLDQLQLQLRTSTIAK